MRIHHEHCDAAVERHVGAGKYVSDSHHDREVIVGNWLDVKDCIVSVSTRIHEASMVPDHDYIGWRVNGESHCTLSKASSGPDTMGAYPRETSREEVAMVEEVAGNLWGREEVGGLVYARCCAGADCQ